MPPVRRPPAARVLFDEAHSQAWTIRPEVARAMQPSHPEDSSYARAADVLRTRGLAVAAHTAGPLDASVLGPVDVLVLAHPSEPKWERTVPGGGPRLHDAELDAIEAFVRAGGGLVLLAEEEQDKYGNNLAGLAARFGIAIEHDVVSDYAHHHRAPTWVLADLADTGGHGDGVDLLAGVRAACFYRTTRLTAGDGARILARASQQASSPGAPLLSATTAGRGRVVVCADSDLFGDDCLGELDHAELWANLLTWAATPGLARPADRPAPAVAADRRWRTLRRETEALRALQRADGSVDPVAAARAGGHAERMAAAIEGLVPRFAHQADQLAATAADLRRWAEGGLRRPDFARSLELLRPDLHRRDGIEHLVVLPMYKQNGDRDTRFEALVVRVPWPRWLAELEHTRFANAKFVPVELVAGTSGYDSDCATLFPETVAVSGRPANHFGAIFCDREAERFRRVCGRAAAVLGLALPPDAAALLGSEALSRDAFALWDLVHDRAHSRGDLPFDPFMIRQRSPYWMYALEELRCDLTAFGEAVALEDEGFAFARHVRYAIVLDRVLRFPITGARVRNYDGLGGQLLFAHLHRHGCVRWADNRLAVDWGGLAGAVAALREQVEELYRAGIDRSKVAHWRAAHDLVSSLVPASAGSRWAAGDALPAGEDDPGAWIEAVLPDEFPLSMFYLQLQSKLGDAPARAAA